MNYYNEHDKRAAQWLRDLIQSKLIPQGDVDERDIKEVKPSELDGYTQHHFFAGIGGWSYALQLAGWPADRPVWTGSCPCQPFSTAGKGKGTADERHLWPAFRWLIAQCRPAIVFGEQVASSAGRDWLCGVRSDMEVLGYAVGAADLCGASVGAPQRRQRLWWVGHSGCISNELRGKSGEAPNSDKKNQREGDQRQRSWDASRSPMQTGGLANPIGQGLQGRISGRSDSGREIINGCSGHHRATNNGLADTTNAESTFIGSISGGPETHYESIRAAQSWSSTKWVYCRDGKYRRVPLEPSLFPLAPRIPGAVGLLKGAGNSIIPQVAQTFIEAYLDSC